LQLVLEIEMFKSILQGAFVTTVAIMEYYNQIYPYFYTSP